MNKRRDSINWRVFALAAFGGYSLDVNVTESLEKLIAEPFRGFDVVLGTFGFGVVLWLTRIWWVKRR